MRLSFLIDTLQLPHFSSQFIDDGYCLCQQIRQSNFVTATSSRKHQCFRNIHHFRWRLSHNSPPVLRMGTHAESDEQHEDTEHEFAHCR